MKFLLDSVILIDHFNGIGAATDYLRTVQQESAISVITRAEVLRVDAAKQLIITQFLNQFVNLEMSVTVADEAARLRHDESWKLPDAIQAAFAHLHQLTLVTRNLRDFPPERYSFVVIPYTL